MVVPLVWTVKVKPASVVRSIVPQSPTAIAVCESSSATALSVLPCGKGFCQTQPDCASDGVAHVKTTEKNTDHPLKNIFIEWFPWKRSGPGDRETRRMRLHILQEQAVDSRTQSPACPILSSIARRPPARQRRTPFPRRRGPPVAFKRT